MKRALVPRARKVARLGAAPVRSVQAWPGIDTVGSLGQDGIGYGYNRFSGQRYYSCVFDEGYGRTRPCDAGGSGGGGGMN